MPDDPDAAGRPAVPAHAPSQDPDPGLPLSRRPSQPSFEPLLERRPEPRLTEVSPDKVDNVIQILDVALLLAHHVGNVTAQERLPRLSRGFFKPNLNDKRMCRFFVHVPRP